MSSKQVSINFQDESKGITGTFRDDAVTAEEEGGKDSRALREIVDRCNNLLKTASVPTL